MLLLLFVVRAVADLVRLGRGKYPRIIEFGSVDDSVGVALNLVVAGLIAWALWGER